MRQRCLLPDAIEELLPPRAQALETLRRTLLDLYARWGYQLVIPPLLAFTESLLLDTDSDMDLCTFKVVDQLSGRTLGLRADITPQVARIDAHSLAGEQPNRLCYAGSVLHTKPRTLMASRAPLQIGAELCGDASLHSDLEVICLMLETLDCVGITAITLDLGHVGVYRTLLEQAQLPLTTEQQLYAIVQRKEGEALQSFVKQCMTDPRLAAMIVALPHLHGDADSVLTQARQRLAEAPQPVHKALDQLEQVVQLSKVRFPTVAIYCDLGELPSYRYHTGLVFSALASGCGQAIAYGGRYDGAGAAFGRARPATGFNSDLKVLLDLATEVQGEVAPAIFAPPNTDQALWQAVQLLRQQGERVVAGLPDQPVGADCDRQLVYQQGQWVVVPLNG